MKGLLSFVLIVFVILSCLSLVTSRQQQRLDFNAIESESRIKQQLEQDFQNLTAKQQELEQTQRIERLSREVHQMDSIPPDRTLFVKQQPLP